MNQLSKEQEKSTQNRSELNKYKIRLISKSSFKMRNSVLEVQRHYLRLKNAIDDQTSSKNGTIRSIHKSRLPSKQILIKVSPKILT